jgi:hypothetical protein
MVGMSLNQEQKQALAGWVAEGLSLSDIQKRLEADFDVRITYMDLRFLVDDLDLEVAPSAPTFDEPKKADPAAPAPADGKVSVSLDQVARPDALASGRVTFSDGVTAAWLLDQMGRLSLESSQPDYRPSPEDQQSFQVELSQALKNAGMY